MNDTDVTAQHLEADQDAEQAVLGSLLINPNAIEDVAPMLEPSDFWLPPNQLIYATMLRLRDQGYAIDAVTVAHGLNGDLDAAGGIGYLAALVALVPTSIHAEHYARLVRESSRRRRCIAAGETLTRVNGDVDATILAAEAMLQEIKRQKGRAGWQDKQSSLDALMARLEGPATEDDAGMLTGLGPLDRITRGLRRGDLWVIGARPSIGKTSLAATIAHDVGIRQGAPTLFFSLEMQRDRIWEKLLSIDTGIPWARITSHRMNGDELARVRQSRDRIAAAPFDVIPAREWTVTRIREAAREFHAENALALMVVDYLQIIEPEGRRENRTQEIAAFTGGLKAAALELNCAVSLLSQLNREPEQRPKSDPLMSELRDGGTQEQDADVVILLSRPHDRDETEGDVVQPVTVQVAKNRLGETGKLTLGFRGPQMQFVEMEQQRQEPKRIDRLFAGYTDDTAPF